MAYAAAGTARGKVRHGQPEPRRPAVNVQMKGLQPAFWYIHSQMILWIQPCGSARWPNWTPTSSSRSRMVTGPGEPSPTVQPPSEPLTVPTGVMTAAVPHANTSVISPDAQPARHSSTEIRPSDAGMPRSGASVSSASLVMPGSVVPVSAGVMIRASGPEP